MPSQSFEIEGGHAISGTIRPSGNKNAALPLIAATLLTDEEVLLRNVPDIRDVAELVSVLDALLHEAAAGSAQATTRELEEEELDRLRELGYLDTDP